MKKPGLTVVVAVLIALASFLQAAPTQAAAATPTVVMTGLDNPRGLALGENGALYVAEAGRGGSGPCAFVRGQVQCYGPSGAVTRLRGGVQERIVSGLPSYAPSSGREATGAHDVSIRDENKIYATIGLGGNPAEKRAQFSPDFGWLTRVNEQNHTWTKFADVSGYETAANPGGGPVDSNPYGLLPGGGGRVVTDAGGNSLLRVSGSGSISTIGIFPSRAQGRFTDAVPTSVAVGPDDAYYVGELTGVPFVPGSSRIYRVVPGQDPQVFLEGFSFIIDLTFGPDDNLYVLEFASAPFPVGPGDLVRVAPDGTRTIIATGLVNPTSVVIAEESGEHDDENDDDGGELTFYVSNCGTCAGTGEVIRIRP